MGITTPFAERGRPPPDNPVECGFFVFQKSDDGRRRQRAVVVVLRILKNFKSFSEAEYYMKSKTYTD